LVKNRLFSLDAARGLAALSVIVWHYSSVASIGAPFARQRIPDAPFHPLLWPFYEHGWIAVDLFFCLSGFVFFWLYEASVRERRIGVPEFSRLRFARLYPLHFATLVIVAVLQSQYMGIVGMPFTYQLNDGLHFVLSLLMLDHSGDAFNAPTWSIAVEVLVYAAFFLLARAGRLSGWRLPLAISLAAILLEPIAPLFLRGIGGFFLGGVIYRAWLALDGKGARPAHIIAGCAAAAWTITLLEGHLEVLHQLAGTLQGRAQHTADFLVEKGEARFAMYVPIPLTVLSLALYERLGRLSLDRLSWLGDISYALYLLHFPLLLSAAILTVTGVLPSHIMETAAGFIGFFALLIVVSIAVHRAFERPAQTFLRNAWRRRLIAG
jgi:peptidoglycan/LPS O-acetylase OafA/YrhL